MHETIDQLEGVFELLNNIQSREFSSIRTNSRENSSFSMFGLKELDYLKSEALIINFIMHFRSLRRVGVTVGLAGCISMFQAGKSAALLYYNLAYPQYNGDVINGRDIQQCGNNPCQSMPCKYGGICLMADKESYQCVCRDGFSGRYFPACPVNMAGFALWRTRNRTSVCVGTDLVVGISQHALWIWRDLSYVGQGMVPVCV